MMPLILLVGGGTLLLVGGELLVRGATRIAAVLGIPSLIVGLTIVAACTGAPELAVSLMGCLKSTGSPELAVGNVVGSNICNILLILGAAALVHPIAISVSLLRREIPIMILTSLLLTGVVACCGNEAGPLFPRWSGILFVLAFLFYTFWMIREIRKKENAPLAEGLCARTTPPVRTVTALFWASGLFLVGLVMLLAGSNWFIEGAVVLAGKLGVSKLVIGLTVLAVGTSLPELVVSIVAAFRGQSDLAVGNVVGSNIFNILIVLGLSGALVPGGIPVTRQALMSDFPVLVGSALIAGYLCLTGRKLARWEGAVLLLLYTAYIAFLVLRS